MFNDIHSFVRALEKKGELKRIRVEVDPELEITEIATRVVKQEGPALLFEKVKGSPYPLLINLFGNMKRIEIALGMPPAKLGEKLLQFAQSVQPPSIGKIWKSRDMFWRMKNFRVARAWRAPAQQVVEEPQLDQLPVLKCWPADGGKFLTFGVTLTQHPLHKGRNVGLYRLQLFSPNTTGMHWQIQKGGGFHYHEAEKLNKPLPVAIVIGSDPYLLMAAIAPLPEGVDEVAFSGFLRGAPMKLTRAKTIPLRVPASADFILEGEVPPQERIQEGPFGDHFGHYSHAAPFPVFHARKVTRRKKPIYVATVVGKPPQEDKYLGDAMQEVLGPMIRVMRPEIKDLWAYYEAGFHNLLVVGVQQRYGKEAMKTAFGILGEGQLSLSKCVVLVDGAVNVRDFDAVLHAIHQNFDPAEDVMILPGTSMDTLDFTSFKMNLGSKMILDATRKPETRHGKRKVFQGEALDNLKRKDTRILGWQLWQETMLVVQVQADGRSILERLVQDPDLEGVKIIAVVSADVDIDDRENMIWGLFTRFDCARDVVFTRVSLQGPTIQYGGRMGIDATWKTGYPDPLEMPEEIREKVNVRWAEYGI